MTEQPKDGGAAFPDARDQLAMQIMFKVLDRDPTLYREPKLLAARSYSLANAMILAREATQ